jgi:hypothetical protein
MRQLVERIAVIIRRIPERVLRGQVDRICAAVVESTVALVVADLGAGVFEDLLTGFDHFPLLRLLPLVRRDSVDLLSIEDRVDPADRPGVALLRRTRLRCWIGAVSCLPDLVELPVFDMRSLLALFAPAIRFRQPGDK